MPSPSGAPLGMVDDCCMLYATHAVVDLTAIAANLRAIRQRVGGRSILAAVKANAYGHGAVPVSQYLENNDLADQLGIATIPEAIELRQAGITLPILKLSACFPEELAAALQNQVSLTVVSAETIGEAQAAAETEGVVVDVHLKLDSGMRRIGAELSDALALAQQVSTAPNLNLAGLFTHLPISDSPDGDDFTNEQLRRFVAVADEVQAVVGPIAQVHAANSGAILGHDLTGTTMVRPGIMMYGYYPDPKTPKTLPLEQAFSLVSRVSFVKRVPAGETVGYGRTWKSDHDTVIATVPVGYADGYSRLMSNRGWVIINGNCHPIRGRVCMDQLMVEADEEVKVGDEVVLIGRQGEEFIPTDEVADIMGTITYEVTCLISSRVPRTYVR